MGREATTEIFLSYARADFRKARRLADAIEAAGHSVWWDFEIEGGKRFAAAIDEALQSAGAVLVLWSSSSINSAWVQDEAAAGRDTGRLVPVLLEPVLPPLGFRQYQCIDLGDWHGRNVPKQVERILSALAALEPRPSIARASGTQIGEGDERRSSRVQLRAMGAAAAILVALIIAALLWLRPSGASAAPSVTVAPSSAAPAQPSTALAHDVAVDLGRFQAGPLSGMSVAESGRGSSVATDYRLEIGNVPGASGEHADIALLDKANQVIWTTSIDSPAGRAMDLRQQASAAAGAVLACAVRTADMKPRPAGEVLRLYLTGCAGLFDAATDQSNPALEKIFRQITVKAPDLADGWSGLALVQAWSIASVPDAQIPTAVRTASETLQRAKAIDPHVDLNYAAEARLGPMDTRFWQRALSALDRGIKDNPESALLLSERTNVLQHLGRMEEAVASARSAVQLNPLSPSFSDGYISALAYAGHIDEAQRNLGQAERIWPDSSVLEQTRYRIESRYGDAAAAEQMLKQRGDVFGLADNPAVQAFAAARISATPANKKKAIEAFEEAFSHDPNYIFGLVQALGTFARVDEAFAAMQRAPTNYLVYGSDVLFRPDMRSILKDPRFMAVAARLGLVRTWRQTRVWPDFCSDPQLPYQCKAEAAKYPA